MLPIAPRRAAGSGSPFISSLNSGAYLAKRAILAGYLPGLGIRKRQRWDSQDLADVNRARIDEPIGDRYRPPDLRIAVKSRRQRADSLVFQHGVCFAEVGRLPVDLFGLALFIDELVERARKPRADRPA